MLLNILIFLCFLNLLFNNNTAVQVINNGLAPPEIVHTPVSTIRKLFCSNCN